MSKLKPMLAEDGTCFKIGSGFTAAQRVELWKVKDSLTNQLVKYKFFRTGHEGCSEVPCVLGTEGQG